MDKEIINKFKIIIGDKGYDSEESHIIAKRYGLFAIIPARNEDIPIYCIKGENRKKMKRYLPDQKNTKEGQ